MGLSLFQENWYLEACAQRHEIKTIRSLNKDGNEQGRLSFEIRKKMGFRIIGMPVLTQYTGPVLFYPENLQKNHSRISFEVKVIKDLIHQLPKADYINFNCSPQIHNVLPFIWSGFRVSPKYTYVLNDIKNHPILLNNVKGSIRTILKKDPEFEILNETKTAIIYQLSKMVFQRQNEKTPFSLTTLEKIFTALKKNAEIIYLSAYSDSHTPIASSVTVIYNKRAYFLLSGMDEKFKNSNAITHLIWQSILKASEKVDIFDFEGSLIPGVEYLFRAFGGDLVPYYNIQRTNHPVLSIIKK